MNAKNLIKLLETNGWEFVNQEGSHKKFKNPAFKLHVIVPEHGNKDLGKGLVSKIMKQAGLK